MLCLWKHLSKRSLTKALLENFSQRDIAKMTLSVINLERRPDMVEKESQCGFDVTVVALLYLFLAWGLA